VKAVLVGDDQQILASSNAPLVTQTPHPSWREQDPQDWWKATRAVLADLRRQSNAFESTAAVGLSGQMHAPVLLDADGAVVRSAILWNDGRAVAEARELNESLPRLADIAGVVAMASFTAPKVLWLARHEPGHLRRAVKVLSAKDYIRFCLAGDYATDMSDASGTMWLDIAKRDWSPEIVAASQLRVDQLSSLHEGDEITGYVRSNIALELGLRDEVAITAGGGDAASAAIGLGIVDDGDGIISIGTSAQYLIAANRHRPAQRGAIHAYAHALPRRWFQMAAMLNGGSCLQWAARLFQDADIDELLAAAEASYRGPSDLIFLPYLAGERSPHNDPDAKGVLYGLTPAATSGDIVQAVLEGVAFAIADGQDGLSEAGIGATTLAVTGGGARSRFWMGLLATILGRPITIYPESGFAAAFGAARLARLALTREAPADICVKPRGGRSIEPELKYLSAYRGRRVIFRRTYAALRENFQWG
jgi:xylulokinase